MVCTAVVNAVIWWKYPDYEGRRIVDLGQAGASTFWKYINPRPGLGGRLDGLRSLRSSVCTGLFQNP